MRIIRNGSIHAWWVVFDLNPKLFLDTIHEKISFPWKWMLIGKFWKARSNMFSISFKTVANMGNLTFKLLEERTWKGWETVHNTQKDFIENFPLLFQNFNLIEKKFHLSHSMYLKLFRLPDNCWLHGFWNNLLLQTCSSVVAMVGLNSLLSEFPSAEEFSLLNLSLFN